MSAVNELMSARTTSHKQQRLQSHTVTLIWHASKYKVHKLHQSMYQVTTTTTTTTATTKTARCYTIRGTRS